MFNPMDMGRPLGKASACLREAASAKAGANLLFNRHGGFRPLLESTPSTILGYPCYFIITAVRSLEERAAHACTPKWRFGTQAWPLMQLAGKSRVGNGPALQF